MYLLNTITDIEQVANESRQYCWQCRESWSISKHAWEWVQLRGIAPMKIFAHPKLILEHPRLLSYYRKLAGIPRTAPEKAPLDVSLCQPRQDAQTECSDSAKIAQMLNTHISAIIESTSAEPRRARLSWGKLVHVEASKAVKRLLVRSCLDQQLIDSAIDKTVGPVAFDPTTDYVSSIFKYRGFKLKNKKAILFGSEPDISIIDEKGMPICAIEVKGGTDPAGALERLGAIKKSFQHAISQSKRVVTILVVSCVTKEMQLRLRRDRDIKSIFNLTLIVSDMDEREKFLKRINEIIQAEA